MPYAAIGRIFILYTFSAVLIESFCHSVIAPIANIATDFFIMALFLSAWLGHNTAHTQSYEGEQFKKN
jgi:hypothetical protein